MVAGTASGVGKTTVALALLALLRERGLSVQPFKCGPDFLDTGHHGVLSGRPSRNLDTWMMDKPTNRRIFLHASAGRDAAVVEGVMGLYDGATGSSEQGSPAEIAKMLDLPVVLVINAAKSARSIAAVVKGFESFDPDLRFAGIVLNYVGSESHYRLLKDAISGVTQTPILGWLPKSPEVAIGERHLGLHTAEETTAVEDRTAGFVAIGRRLNLEPLLQCLWQPPVETADESLPGATEEAAQVAEQDAAAQLLAPDLRAPFALLKKQKKVRIGVARDRAFSFYYEDNFDLLRLAGAELVPFSPMADGALPDGVEALYLGGGYPELHAAELAANAPMRAAVREFVAAGGPVYGECGGMIYLGRSLTLLDGSTHAMAGGLELDFAMTPRLVHFGYVEVEFADDCLLGPAGTRLRGHSFHCSRVTAGEPPSQVYRLRYRLSGREEVEGYKRGNLLASYVHLHFGGAPAVAAALVASARARTLARAEEKEAVA